MTLILRCGITVVFPKHIIKKYNPSTHNFTVALVDYIYMFRLLKVIIIRLYKKSVERKLCYV
jgi:hypothetical protein